MSTAKDIMTKDPAICTCDMKLKDVAALMVEHDCGEIPVVNNLSEKKPIGVITDRDICCRAVAKGLNPNEVSVQECMTSPCMTVSEEDSVQDCCDLMEEKQIRRLPVVDKNGSCCGMVSQADIVNETKNDTAASVVKNVSRSTDSASQVSQH